MLPDEDYSLFIRLTRWNRDATLEMLTCSPRGLQMTISGGITADLFGD